MFECFPIQGVAGSPLDPWEWGFGGLCYIIALVILARAMHDSVSYYIKVILFTSNVPFSFIRPGLSRNNGHTMLWCLVHPVGGPSPVCVFIWFVAVNTSECNMVPGYLTKTITKSAWRHRCSRWRGHDCLISRVITVNTVSGQGPP